MNDREDPSGAGSEGREPEDAGLSMDEKFARLVASVDGSTVAGRGAKEEAARTRELRAQWSKKPPQATPWRADGPKAAGPQPTIANHDPADPTWKTGGPGEPGKPKKSARKRALGSAKAVTALALVGVIAYGLWPRHHAAVPLNISPAGTAAPWTSAATPEASSSPSPTFTNPDDQYFVGSPALSWADNEAGFVIPPVAALNGVSRSDVLAGYQELEKVMAAGNLDATILNGGSVGDFVNLLDPSDGTGKELEAWIAHPSYADDPTALVTRFNPATSRLLGHTVKVEGSMSAKAGPQHDIVLLTADYIFVYAVGPATHNGDGDIRVSVHRTMQFEVVNPADFQSMAGKAWIQQYAESLSNIQCYKYDGYVDPEFTPDGVAPNQSGTIDPYATGNLLTPSAQPSPTSSQGECETASQD